jgi:hypothetical protein
MILPAIIAGAQAVYGIYRGVKAQQGLNALATQRKARYMDAAGPIEQNRAMGMKQMQQGLSPVTRAVAEQTFAGQRASQYRQATDLSGGQLSSAIGRIGALGNTNLALNLAQQSQSATERGQGLLMNANQQISGLQQRDVANDIFQRQQMEQAYGQAKQQGFQDVLGAGMGFAQMNMAQKNIDADREMYGRVNGIGQEIPGTSRTLANSPMMQGYYPQPNPNPTTGMGLDEMYNLPSSMGGLGGRRTSYTAGFPVDPSQMPYNMGGTGGIRKNYAPYGSDISFKSNLPNYMGGTGGLNRFTTPTSLYK